MLETILHPVERNRNLEQVELYEDGVVVREKPAKNGKNLGVINKGIYNIIDTKEVDANVGTWLSIQEDNRWIFVDGTIGSILHPGTEAAEYNDLEDIDDKSSSGDSDKSNLDNTDDVKSFSPETNNEADNNQRYRLYRVGDIVKISKSATRYVSGAAIPDGYKDIKLYVYALARCGNVVFLSKDKFGRNRIGRVYAKDLKQF